MMLHPDMFRSLRWRAHLMTAALALFIVAGVGAIAFAASRPSPLCACPEPGR